MESSGLGLVDFSTAERRHGRNMATTRNTAPAATAAKRPTRGYAGNAQESPAVPSNSTSPDQEERLRHAEYLLGKEAGYREGIAEGERRERARLSPEERFEEQWHQLMKREMNPLLIKAQDRVLASMFYALGGLAIISAIVIFWRKLL